MLAKQGCKVSSIIRNLPQDYLPTPIELENDEFFGIFVGYPSLFGGLPSNVLLAQHLHLFVLDVSLPLGLCQDAEAHHAIGLDLDFDDGVEIEGFLELSGVGIEVVVLGG